MLLLVVSCLLFVVSCLLIVVRCFNEQIAPSQRSFENLNLAQKIDSTTRSSEHGFYICLFRTTTVLRLMVPVCTVRREKVSLHSEVILVQI